MKKAVKVVCIVLGAIVLSICDLGCRLFWFGVIDGVLGSVIDSYDVIGSYSDSSSFDSETSASVVTSSQAISAVQYSFGLEQKIARELGFNNFYSPDFGVGDATEKGDGSWKVTLKGSMGGYVDEYVDDFESYKFKVTADVSKYGWVDNIRVEKIG